MKKDFLKSISLNIVLIFTLFICNKTFLDVKTNYHFSLEVIYLFFTIFSIIIMILSQLVYSKNKDIVGIVFLLNTSIKLITTYVFFRSAINSNNENTEERLTIFVLFLVFLTIETVSTIRLLNKKQ